ncbi:hypothetical protein ACEPAI_1643 [Sanghuangporus weigelae]
MQSFSKLFLIIVVASFVVAAPYPVERELSLPQVVPEGLQASPIDAVDALSEPINEELDPELDPKQCCGC